MRRSESSAFRPPRATPRSSGTNGLPASPILNSPWQRCIHRCEHDCDARSSERRDRQMSDRASIGPVVSQTPQPRGARSRGDQGDASMTELSKYEFSAFREGEVDVYRGSGDGLDPILLVAPTGEHAARESFKRLEHEYALRALLDPDWAARPVALAPRKGRMSLVLE